MSIEGVLEAMRLKIERAGSAKAWAEEIGVSPSYVSDILNGNREPGASVLEALRLEKVVTYRPRRAA